MGVASEFPDDENGEVLRQMAEDGDDLSRSRDIDFVVVMPGMAVAQELSDHFEQAGYRVRMEEANTVPELPWDVVVTKHMVPTHAGITEFESELESVAVRLGGRNDGWGCFEQSGQQMH
jgi:hypothetical protein